MTQLLVFASVLFSSAFYWNDFQLSRNFVFMVLGTGWITGIVYKRVHWTAGLVFGWTLLSAVKVFASPKSLYLDYGREGMATLEAVAAISAVSILLVVVPLLFADWKAQRSILQALSWVCIIDSALVVIQWALGANTNDRSGLFGNTSMNACIIACLYPILKRKKEKVTDSWSAIWGLFTLIAPVVAVLVSRSNMAFFSFLAAAYAPDLVNVRRLSRRRALFLVLILGCLLLCAYLLMGEKFGDNNGRFPLWHAALSWWSGRVDPKVMPLPPALAVLAGTGTGTYFILGPNIQINVMHQIVPLFPWLRDWPQILFEQGLIGVFYFGLMITSAIQATIRDRKWWVLSSIAAYAVTMVGNYPMHLPVSGFLGAFLIVLAFDRGSSKGRAPHEEALQ